MLCLVTETSNNKKSVTFKFIIAEIANCEERIQEMKEDAIKDMNNN